MTPTTDSLVIDRRFRGPSTSGNGGYSCGAVAARVQGRARVTLRSPPPLDTPLRVEIDGEGALRVLDGDRLVAEAAPTDEPLHVAPFVPVEIAEEAGRHYAGHVEHLFPECFTCGPARAEGDGLRIFTGPVPGRAGLVAATWTPAAELAGSDGELSDPIVWAALDCPSAWPHLGDGTAAVLGRLTVRIDRRPRVGRTYVVVGEDTGTERRKRFGAAAIYSTDGELMAASNATWIVIDT